MALCFTPTPPPTHLCTVSRIIWMAPKTNGIPRHILFDFFRWLYKWSFLSLGNENCNYFAHEVMSLFCFVTKMFFQFLKVLKIHISLKSTNTLSRSLEISLSLSLSHTHTHTNSHTRSIPKMAKKPSKLGLNSGTPIIRMGLKNKIVHHTLHPQKDLLRVHSH